MFLGKVYSDVTAIKIPVIIRKFKRLDMFVHIYGSSLWNNGKGKHILSCFVRSQPQYDIGTMWPGQVEYYFEVDLIHRHDESMLDNSINTNNMHNVDAKQLHVKKTHRFAKCTWYRSIVHSQRLDESVWTCEPFMCEDSIRRDHSNIRNCGGVHPCSYPCGHILPNVNHSQSTCCMVPRRRAVR